MVFSDLNTTENSMSSIAAGGGGSPFPNVNSSVPQSTKSNPQTNSSATPSSNELPLPTYNINDPRSILKTLIRFIMRTFYDIPKSLVIEYIYHYERIKQQDLADRLCLDSKQVRLFIQEFKRDKFIIEDHRLESNDGTTGGRRNQDQYYYKIDTTTFINVVKYRLINMQTYVENLERQQTYKQSNYKCEQCSKEYTELDIGKLYDLTQDALICLMCGGIVHEDIETKETTTTNRQTATMSLFNEQMKPIFQILEKIDEIMNNEQQLKTSSDQDFFQQNGNSSSLPTNHLLNKDSLASSSTAHRSHASNVFDRTSAINHDIQIIIEKDDDDHYSHMDIDETSNTDSIIPSSAISASSTAISSRGPGKPGKKSTKLIQSAAEVATQPVTSKMKMSNKKVPYEPKPLPHWFIRSTVYNDHDEEHRLNNLSLHHSTTNSTSMSRQLSNQKLTKSTTVNDIKQMLLIHESRRKKTLSSLTTMEDSLSPPTPTPIQISKTTDSQ
jgi:transcription initiation factor IIE alpha subunit